MAISTQCSVLARVFGRAVLCWNGLARSAASSAVSACVLMVLAFSAVAVTPSGAFAETRSLKLYYIHTREKAEVVFKRNGKYDQAGLKKLNRLLRDFRRNEPTNMDPRLFDLVWEIYRQVGARDYINVVSAYRSPATNEMLRRTRGGQAKKSQHMLGKAMDFFIPGVKLATLRATAMKLQGGGVGYYPKSGSPFVHVDVASVRAWPRMSRQELVKLFPDGKTLHLPPDGKPLPGYQVALAEYKRRGGAIVSTSGGSSGSDSKRSGGGLIAALFGGGDEDEEPEAIAQAPAPEPAPRTEVAALPEAEAAAPVQELAFTLPAQGPMPDARPVLEPPVELAALAPPQPVLPAQAEVDAFAAAANAEVNETPQETLPVDLASIRAPIPEFLAERSGAPAAAPDAPPVEVASLPVPNLIRARMMADTAQSAEAPAGQQAPAQAPSETAVAAETAPTPAFGAAETEMVAALPTDADFVPLPIRRPGEQAAAAPAAVEMASLAPARGGRLATPTAPLSSPRKGDRPTAAEGAKQAPRAAIRTEPKLNDTMISKWALAQERVQSMTPPPDKGRHFVVTQLRAAPTVVFANAFAPDGGELPHNQFTGSAVNFVTVARFGN